VSFRHEEVYTLVKQISNGITISNKVPIVSKRIPKRELVSPIVKVGIKVVTKESGKQIANVSKGRGGTFCHFHGIV